MRLKLDYSNPWRRWFAWRPVKVKHEIVWLEFVYRRHSLDPYSVGCEYANTDRAALSPPDDRPERGREAP